MRWEYRDPEEKLFIADGHEAFLYVPEDSQVTIQTLSSSDLAPLELLLGSGDINKSFTASWEKEIASKVEHTVILRLTPRKDSEPYRFITLELDQSTFDIRRIVISERAGNTNDLLISNSATNVKVDKKQFRFKTPKGVEEIRLDE